MATRLPLSALLSHALVAFTIEFDNEFERQMRHRTTRQGSSEGDRSGPWLVSMVMWPKFMRFIPEEGISARELKPLTGLSAKELAAWLTRLAKWWGYLTVDRARVVRPSAAGRQAQAIWLPLTDRIEKRWEDRFGKVEIDALRNASPNATHRQCWPVNSSLCCSGHEAVVLKSAFHLTSLAESD